jgi:peroxiredoxin
MTRRKTGAPRGRAKQPPPSLRTKATRWLRRHRMFVGFVVVAPLAIAAFILVTDPFAEPTAIDADGTRVQTGVIPTEDAAPRVGRPAPNFVLADYDGNAIRLDDYRGKTVLLNFWATWCTTCAVEKPEMQQIALDYGDDVVVLAVNQGEGRGRAKSWSDSRDLDAITFVLDTNREVSRAYRLPGGLPHSFLIDEDGIVRHVRHGAMFYREMATVIDETRGATTSGR